MMPAWLYIVALAACTRSTPPPAAPEPETPVNAPVSFLTATDAPAPPTAGEISLGKGSTLASSPVLALLEHRWRLGDDRGWLWVARTARSATMTVHPSDQVALIDQITRPPAEGEALINGGFYDEGPMGLVLHQGNTATALAKGGGSGIVHWRPDAGFGIAHRDAYPPPGSAPQEALQSIDRLVDQGVSLVNPKADSRLAARSAVALTSDHVLLVVAGGPVDLVRAEALPSPRELDLGVAGAEGQQGMPLWGFAQALVALGATQALNLDGGISSELTAKIDDHVWHLGVGVGTINAIRLTAGTPHAGAP